MSAEVNDDAESPGATGLAAVGSRLSSIRREQQREVAAVATALHLRPEVVEALESGNESALPAVTFVRGYLKAYARLLGLDEQEILAALPTDDGYRARPLKAVGMRRKRTLRLPLGKWFVWVGLAALVLALITYGVPFVERMLDKVEQPEEDGNSLAIPFGAPDSGTDVMQLPEFSTEPEPEQLPESGSLEDAIQEPAGEDLVQEPVSSAAGATVNEQPPVAAIAVTGPAEISMQFREDSWVEMESHGRKLVVGTQRAGSQRTVSAEPPIQILLGNAPGVEIRYRGKVVDLQSYQRGKVARLVLED